MQKIRSFIAIALPSAVQSAAGDLVARLSEAAPGIRWVEHENLHLTLKFLGDVDNREVMDVCSMLRKCCEAVSPFALEIRGVGAFPDLDRARVIWSGVDDSTGSLCDLANTIDKEMSQIGFKREPRDYQPHLTLGRLKKGSRIGESFADAAKAESDNVLGTVQVDEIRLYASYLERHGHGPTYNVMDRVSLK